MEKVLSLPRLQKSLKMGGSTYELLEMVLSPPYFSKKRFEVLGSKVNFFVLLWMYLPNISFHLYSYL